MKTPTTSKSLHINILCYKSSVQGLKRDAEIIEAITKRLNINGKLKNRVSTVRCIDPREHPVQCDVQFHVDFPVLANLSWARVNILILNPGGYSRDVHESNMHHFDYIVCTSRVTVELVRKEIPSISSKLVYIPWMTRWERPTISTNPSNEIVMFIGNSKSKMNAAKKVINVWKDSYPKLTIYSYSNFVESVPSWIAVKTGNFTDDERMNALVRARGCMIVAEEDTNPHTLLEALECGSICIVNDIDVYMDVVDDVTKNNIIVLETAKSPKNLGQIADLSSLSQDMWDTVVTNFVELCEKPQSKKSPGLGKRGEVEWTNLWADINGLIDIRLVKKQMPPVLEIKDCPDISVITLLYNRRKFFDIAAHNMLLTDYPKSKIQWILVDDSDNSDDSPIDKVVKFQNSNYGFKDIIYVPLTERKTIGEKRNIGVNLATENIILMMDDDDHYPESSFRRRVAWLESTWSDGEKPSCAACTSIAMYDLVNATSAVNVPPMNLALSSRISEATLTFYRGFWEDKHFPDINIAEGESWLVGCERYVMEMPPQQIIVAFNHKQNISSRKIPARADKGCFWGFPKEYMEFIHEIAGVKVEWEK